MPTVYNRSTVCTDHEVAVWADAVQFQLNEQFARAWDLGPWALVADGSPRYISFYVVDEDKDVPDALAYHDYDGRPVGVVLAKTCLEAGASVSSALSHEVLETRVDAFCNATHRNSDGWSYWREVCDAVQTQEYNVSGVTVSNFCRPHWFAPGSAFPYDWMGTLSRPFEVAPGGYQVRHKDLSESTVFGRLFGRKPQVLGEKPPWHGWRGLAR